MAHFNYHTSLGNTVKTGMFGANSLFDINTLEDGTIRDGYWDALSVSGVKNVRFPGGMVEIDFNVLKMQNGELRIEVSNFLQDIRKFNQEGNDISVTIVLPTQSYIPSVDYENFVKTVLSQFGDIVSSFEIGNEYSLGSRNPDGLFADHPENAAVRPTSFGITEATYGQQVNRIAVAVDSGIQLAKTETPAAWGEISPEILMQISDIVGAASSFQGSNDHEAADRAILSQITNQTMALIDGFVGHYYYNKSHDDSEFFDGQWREVRSFPERIASWNGVMADMFGVQPASTDFVFTEWNVNIRTEDQLGLKAASITAKQFEYMIGMGVDSAFIWPLQHNTNTAISGHYENSTAQLSPSGQVFATLSSLLNANLNGGIDFKLAETAFSGLDSRLDVASYTSEFESVFVFLNRSDDQVSEDIKLSDGFGKVFTGDQYDIGIDTDTSDGLAMGGNSEGNGRLARRVITQEEYAEVASLPYFDSTDEKHIKVLNGSYMTYLVDPSHAIPKFSGANDVDDFWFVTEPDVSGTLEVQSKILNENDGLAEIRLNPFEISIVHVRHSKNTTGTNGDDYIVGDEFDNHMFIGSGNDEAYGHGGNDQIRALSGLNVLDGGAGADSIVGGSGDDTIDGGTGDDVIKGDIGTFLSGSDHIRGGAGNDLLMGGGGADVFVFSPNEGEDVIGNVDIELAALSQGSRTDFESGVDLVDLKAFNFDSSEDAFAHISDQGGEATFSAMGTSIIFAGLTSADLSQDDIVYM